MIEVVVIANRINWTFYKKINNPNISIVGYAEDLTSCLHITNTNSLCFSFVDLDDLNLVKAHQILSFLQSLKVRSFVFSKSREYAYEVIKYGIIDYVLKPFNEEYVRNLLKGIIKNYSSEIDINKAIKRKIAIPSNSGVHYFEYDTIIRCVAENNYTHIYTSTFSLLVAKTLKKMESLLPYPLYVRTHKSYIVNLNHIKKYSKSKSGFLVLSDEFEVPIAYRRKEKLLQLMDAFVVDV